MRKFPTQASFLIWGLGLVALAVVYLVARSTLLQGFLDMERIQVEQNLDRTLDAVQDDLRGLSGETEDWSTWDDSYQYALGANPQFIAVNRPEESLKRLRIGIMLFLDPTGHPLYGRMLDPSRQEAQDLPPELISALQAQASLWTSSEGHAQGILQLPQGTLLLAVRPIVKTTGQGPPAGTLMMGRFLDQQAARHYGTITHVNLSLREVASPSLAPDQTQALELLGKGSDTLVMPGDDGGITGFGLLRDMWGDPALLIDIRMNRDLLEQGNSTLNNFFLLIVGISLALGLVLRNLLNHLHLARRQRTDFTARTQANSQFLAHLGQEIRTAIQGILEAGYRLRKETAKPASLAQLDELSAVTQRLLGITRAIQDFSALETGQLALEAADFRPRQLLAHLEREFAGRARAKQLALTWELAPAVPERLQGDPLRLSQILAHLVDNALQCTERGQIQVQLKVRVEQNDKYLIRCQVQDSGIGIAPSQQAQLFDPLAPGGHASTRRPGGAGLGLAICKHLVTLMGGEMGVTSTLGTGSEFFFSVWLKRAKKEPPPVDPPDPLVVDPPLSGHQAQAAILLVEDNELDQEWLLGLLNGAGLQPDLAANGLLALEAVQAKPYDLVLMDLLLPVLDGIEATRAIRRLLGDANPPIIALSTSPVHDDLAPWVEAGMNGQLRKPVQAEHLFAILRRWLPAAPPSAGPAPIPGINPGHGLNHLGGDPALRSSLLELFQQIHADDVAMTRQQLERQEWSKACERMHRLRGSALLVGAEQVASLAGDLERALTNPPPAAQVEDLLSALEDELSLVLRGIQSLNPGAAPEQPKH